jgi:putative membrane protein insertion efficiency factor
VLRLLLIGFIKLWRAVISPLYGPVCKFFPSCSEYGLKAVQIHGAGKGSWLIIRRLIRCHPWSLGGYDPVPAATARDLAQAGQPADRTVPADCWAAGKA